MEKFGALGGKRDRYNKNKTEAEFLRYLWTKGKSSTNRSGSVTEGEGDEKVFVYNQEEYLKSMKKLMQPFMEPLPMGACTRELLDSEGRFVARIDSVIRTEEEGWEKCTRRQRRDMQELVEELPDEEESEEDEREAIYIEKLHITFADGSMLRIPEDFGKRLAVFCTSEVDEELDPDEALDFGSNDGSIYTNDVIFVFQPIHTATGLMILLHELGHHKRRSFCDPTNTFINDASEKYHNLDEGRKPADNMTPEERAHVLRDERMAEAFALGYARKILTKMGVSFEDMKRYNHRALFSYTSQLVNLEADEEIMRNDPPKKKK